MNIQIEDLSKDYTRDYGGQIKKPKGKYNPQDDCQTPMCALYALTKPMVEEIEHKGEIIHTELWPGISPKTHPVVWEPAKGMGLLPVWLNELGWEKVYHSGVMEDGIIVDDFFQTFEAPSGSSIQITNSPWSHKYDWIKHSVTFDIPFAILNPSKFLFSKEGARLIVDNGLQVIQMLPRMDFFMPNRGWGGSSQLDTCWITKGLELPYRFNYVDLTDEKKTWNRILKESGRHVNERRENSRGKEVWIRVDPLADKGPLAGTPYVG